VAIKYLTASLLNTQHSYYVLSLAGSVLEGFGVVDGGAEFALHRDGPSRPGAIHRSAWKGYSPKFAGTAFSEVRPSFYIWCERPPAKCSACSFANSAKLRGSLLPTRATVSVTVSPTPPP
jgi:hypothetical protein